MSVELATILLFASMFALLATGIPIAFAIGAVGVGFAIALWGFDHIYVLATAAFTNLQNINLVAIPLFIFMGWIFNKSGIADDMFDAVYAWMGNLRGGLAMGTMVIAAIWGAISADIVAAIFTISSMALPALLKRGYDKQLAVGCIMAGAMMDFLIPPSVEIIIYSCVTGASVGKMYLGCFVPGFLLTAVYISYIGVRCYLRPDLGPAAPTGISWGVRIAKLKGVIMPVLLMLFVLGGIYSGAVTPMEASAVAATGALICAAIKRRLSWKVIWEALLKTLQITCMVGWFLVAVGCFTAVYSGIGAMELAQKIAAVTPGGGIVAIIVMQCILIVAGMIMDDLAIVMIFGPMFVAVVESLGFSTIWFGVLFMVNMQTALMSPPYGFGLFITKAACPPQYNISMADIIRSAVPFLGLQILCLILVLIFQPLATWLPSLLIR